MGKYFRFTPEGGTYAEMVWVFWTLAMLWGVIVGGVEVEHALPLLPALDYSPVSALQSPKD